MELGLKIDWKARNLPWIPAALSTIRPTTSPRLSSLRLIFNGTPHGRSVQSLIDGMGNDLRQIAEEVARIEREFEGVVNLTVVRAAYFELVLGRLNASFLFGQDF